MTGLRELAENVIEGPEIAVPGSGWTAIEDEDGYWSVNAKGDGNRTAEHNHITYGPLEATHRYIAAASPEVVIRLLDTLDSLTAERDELRAAARQYLAHDGSGIKLTGEWAGDWDAGEYQVALRRLRAALSEGGSK